MNPKDLEDAFQQLRRQQERSTDDNTFRDDVWREIRHRRAVDDTSQSTNTLWLACMRALFPPVAATCLAIAILSAWAVGAMWEPPADRITTTSKVLDLGIFAHTANGLAHSNLIVHK